MKDILVEFTDNGAVVHKSPLVIASKKDLPHCFFNPDLSSVTGVSPSYWDYTDEGRIIKASPEEINRRIEYHKSKSPTINPILKNPNVTTVNKKEPEKERVVFVDAKKDITELREDIEEDIQDINEQIEALKSVDAQIANTFDAKTILLQNNIDASIKSVDAKLANALLPINDFMQKDVALKSDIPLLSDIYETIDQLKHEISKQDELKKSSIQEICDSIEAKVADIKLHNVNAINEKALLLQSKMEEDNKSLRLANSLLELHIKKQDVEIKYLKISMVVCAILTIILKVV